METLTARIERLKKEKNAVILAHYYTLPEVQAIADFVGDSLALSQAAAQTTADIILFAGVHFMAETAKILNPTKKVLIPVMEASCSLADCCPSEDFERFLKKYPDHTVLSYINCSAKVKALSDIIVTSGNALKIVNALPQDEKIVFAPDRNLGSYINTQTGRNMILWDGACHVHDSITPEQISEAKKQHPNAEVLAHPECPKSVLELADFVGSTAAMLKHVTPSNQTEFIVVTETGILYELERQNPSKHFYSICCNNRNECSHCQYMKMNTLANISAALETEQPELLLAPNIMISALKPIERMLEMSKRN
ncbi:MAG: quinolinate synthase NadA [Bacteroidales bacterium]|nr:quinolinate synthase NadA [Bacteroidales bacterium]